MSTGPRMAIAILPPGPAVPKRTAPAPRRRAPAIPVLAAVAAGILIDALLGIALPVWLAASAVALLIWAGLLRRGLAGGAAFALLVSAFSVAAGWHHFRWSTGPVDHISRFAGLEPRPVRILGRITDQPAIVPRPTQELPVAIPQFDRAVCTLECNALLAGEDVIPVSGSARLDVAGHLEHAALGDAVDVVGRFSLPVEPQNPGEFDFRRYLRASGIRAVVRCNEPDDVRVLDKPRAGWRTWQRRLRRQAEQLLAGQLSEPIAPLGTALLLGTRSGLTSDVLSAFAESGTMHILAISGANVGILAMLLWGVARVIGSGPWLAPLFVLVGILGYAFLADAQPPVLRAVLMFSAALAGRPWFRTMPLVNGLALAALGVIVWNPSHLFDLSAQLSFLAVAALIWTPTALPARWRTLFESEDDDTERWWTVARLRRTALRPILIGAATLAAVWLFTLPLTMARFHLASPIGLLVNLALAPLVVAILWSGYALLMAGMLWPALAAPLAWLFDGGLRLMLLAVEQTAAIDWGHVYVPGPGNGWLAGYYLCLLAVVGGVPGRRIRHWGWCALLAWIIAGFGAALMPRNGGELRCTFLSVGHGLAVLVEMPNGRTLVYDAGQLQNGNRARDVVQQCLWQRGLGRIDALVISHADVDHFNGVPGLARTTPIGEVLVHPSFLDFRQESVKLTCERLAQRRVPIRTIGAGDRLMLDGRVSVRVRHPQLDRRDPLDNANSLVLEIEHAGRRILLTGDLEQEGLRSLLRQPPLLGDVLLAPHHGSRNANTRELAIWSGARWVVVSDRRRDSIGGLREVYGARATVLSTGECGAVTVTIAPDGTLDCAPFHASHVN